MDKCSSVRSFASLVLPLCLSLTSCSGGNDSSSAITFGGAKCESGVTFAGGSELGYDYLYNFERQLNQNVHVIFDTSHQAQECSNLLTPSQVLPWVRVDYKNSASPSPNDLTFELVEPGGRNSSTLATYDIPDSSKQSIHGAFGYEIRPDISSDYGQVTCEVVYDGSYCPRATGLQNSGQAAASHFMDFSADGTVDCTLKHSDSSTTTHCHGTISAKNVNLEELYYGE